LFISFILLCTTFFIFFYESITTKPREKYHEMDSLLQEREHRNFMVSGHDQYRTNVSNDSFPRSLSHTPLVVDSPLPSGAFALWPPTPLPGARPANLPEPHYPTSLPEDYPTSSPWETSLSPETHPLTTTGPGIDIPSHYSVESFGGVRDNYGSVLQHYGSSDGLASSYGSSSSHGHNFAYSQPPQENDTLSVHTNLSRRFSGTSSLYSVDNIQTDGSTYETESAPTPFDDYTRSVTSTSVASTPLSPVARGSSHGPTRTSPSPIHRQRAIPYRRDDYKRWSAPTYSPNVDPQLQRHPHAHSHPHSHESSPTCTPEIPHPPPPFLHTYVAPRPLLPGGFWDNAPSSVPYVPSNDGCEFSERPDLYGSLTEEHIRPPPEDMNPEDPDMKPHEQDLRFEGDLYTPRWVRGHGNKREGWCGICKPGRWLVLKNSAFWYDKSFTHGISAATGLAFHEPRDMRRMDGNPDVWEGLCHSCNDWVPLVSNKKKGTTWFRHAYKCHTHPKIKDAPKRRRESSQGKQAAMAAAKAKADALKADYSKHEHLL